MRQDYVREFVKLAECCSFQKTAADLYISDSVLSKHIRAMEKEFGVSLFDRTSRKVTLTECGKAFYPHAKEIVAHYEEFQKKLAVLMQQEEKKVSIGALGYMSAYGLYSTIAEFRLSRPDLYVTVSEGKEQTLLEMLKDGKCDFVFTTSAQRVLDYPKELYKRDRLVVVMSVENHLSRQSHVTIEQISNEQLIIHDPQIDYDPFWCLCQNTNFVPHIKARVCFNSTILKLVDLNEGIAVMSKIQAEEYIKHGVVMLPINPNISFNAYIVYNKDRKLSMNAQSFLDFLLDRKN